MQPGVHLPFAVVEIGGETALVLLVIGVFVFTLIVAGALAFVWLARSGTSEARPTRVHFRSTYRMPVSKPAFDEIVNTTVSALARPQETEASRAFGQSLAEARGVLARGYRAAMIVVGLFGIGVSVMMFREATPANLMLLPSALVLLLSLGALLSGLVPSRTVEPIEPIDRELLDRIQVRVSADPLKIALSEEDVSRARSMRDAGTSLDAIARAVYPDYVLLEEFEREAVRSALERAIRSE